jgi:hypothetical protein
MLKDKIKKKQKNKKTDLSPPESAKQIRDISWDWDNHVEIKLNKPTKLNSKTNPILQWEIEKKNLQERKKNPSQLGLTHKTRDLRY